jgi:hypothetical protein
MGSAALNVCEFSIRIGSRPESNAKIYPNEKMKEFEMRIIVTILRRIASLYQAWWSH